jgi:hypothetical protein
MEKQQYLPFLFVYQHVSLKNTNRSMLPWKGNNTFLFYLFTNTSLSTIQTVQCCHGKATIPSFFICLPTRISQQYKPFNVAMERQQYLPFVTCLYTPISQQYRPLNVVVEKKNGLLLQCCQAANYFVRLSTT